MKRLLLRPRTLSFCFLVLVSVSAALAQTPAPVLSPEVLADRRVTFRIAAPKATEVTFKGDWSTQAQPMTKSDDGTWSLTVGPLAPATYIYSFTVDGIAMADPVNPRIKLRMRGSGSLVEVPGETPGLADPREVPHGAVEINWQKSIVLDGETRGIWVYTPPGYAADSSKRYPVLYLLHGNNDRPAGWIDVGNTHFIADNLIAEKKMVPMIIVMPVGHALPFGQPATPPRTNTVVFEQYLLRDVIPTIEAKYRVATGASRHAIAGMSMGAEQSLHIFFNHPDLFSAIGAFSPAGFPALEKEHAAFIADAKSANAKIQLLWIGCGRQDDHFAGSQKIADTLEAHHIQHVWQPSEGAHNYALWRQHLIDFLPRLFHAE
jgi:enterochelin esterase-like enzyme